MVDVAFGMPGHEFNSYDLGEVARIDELLASPVYHAYRRRRQAREAALPASVLGEREKLRRTVGFLKDPDVATSS